ncbi:hypothetical protein PENTCL1PPCAC_23985 [Pristionchus entomophagus]|uniref:Uncharacterized protein n=1 Tax=Pristionchus entomophagus TaxID=358040 RepID=A0AAV5U4J0_9BILA|nr:hypothetical protein PENTCL1PPCAC_23985 [Pristionchus entomophagus]
MNYNTFAIRPFLFSSEPAHVNVSDRARTLHVSLNLMHRGLGPAAERREVVEVRLSVPVGPPEWVGGDAIPRGAHNGAPAVVVRVNSDSNSHGLSLRSHIKDELLVGILIGWPTAVLNIEPERAEFSSCVVQSIHRVDDLLLCRRAARFVAREDVRVDRVHSCNPCVLDVLQSPAVLAARLLTDSRYVEPVAVAVQALEGGSGDGLDGVDAEIRGCV